MAVVRGSLAAHLVVRSFCRPRVFRAEFRAWLHFTSPLFFYDSQTWDKKRIMIKYWLWFVHWIKRKRFTRFIQVGTCMLWLVDDRCIKTKQCTLHNWPVVLSFQFPPYISFLSWVAMDILNVIPDKQENQRRCITCI